MKNMTIGNKAIWITIVATFLVVILAMAGWIYKVYMYDPIGKEKVCIYLTPGLPADSLRTQLSQYIPETTAERVTMLMEYMGYGTQGNERCGYYELSPNLSIYRAARKLVAGSETPIRFTFNNLRTKEQLTERIGETFYMSADTIAALLSDPSVCASYGFDTTTIVAMFIPDTYEFYWTVSPRRFLDRMHYYYKLYWNDERKQLADKAGLSPLEVSVLASIVEEETAKADEMPIVAGLYINRLRRGMLLQADPTVKYAVGDFSLRRILNEHLATDSPYNTYLYAGLPPSPIRIPSKTASEAVLHYAHHNYLYMCAKDDFSGYHLFARTLPEHSRNAAKYHAALNRRNIK